METESLSLPTITVDTLVDENDGDLSAGDVSLREAIAATAAGGTITFANRLAASNAGAGQGVISLSLGQLTIDKSLSIIGLGADKLQVSGNNTSRVFRIDDGDDQAESIEVLLEGLSITGGVGGEGGGILLGNENLTLKNSQVTGNSGGISVSSDPNYSDYYDSDTANIIVQNSEISNNQGSGIDKAVDVEIIDSTVENNGSKGVDFTKTAIITNSRVADNQGDGINNDVNVSPFQFRPIEGALTLSNSVVTGNSGSGIDVSGNVTVTRTQINNNQKDGVNNSSGYGARYYSGTLLITDSTIESNGGDGVASASDATITNSQIINNANTGVTNSDYDGTGRLALNNSTVTGNGQSGVSAFSQYGFGIEIRNSTVSNNSGSGASVTGSRYGGSVSVQSSTIANNSGAGVVSAGGRYGSVSAQDSQIVGNGGLGFQGDTATAEGSTIADNNGVGLTFTASATIRNSTLSNNKGGGIFRKARYGDYGGTSLVVSNSTITSNGGQNARVGGIKNVNTTPYGHTTKIENSTITGNIGTAVGGLKIETNISDSYGLEDDYTTINLKNTIVAGNSGPTADVSGAFDSLGYNLIGNATGVTGFGEAGDIVGTDDNVIDPMLGELQDNGGPTLTRAPLAGSIVIDAGSPRITAPIFDQRGEGFAREVDGDNDGIIQVDIGAVEAIAPTNPTNVIDGTNKPNRLVGTNKADLIRGFGASDILNGKDGNDILEGGSGFDRLLGGGGNDDLSGGSGNDRLRGDSGNDRLNGSTGRDQLNGGTGNDIFVYTSVKDGQDTIQDFRIGEDKFDLSAILSDPSYNSATPFADYVRIGQKGRRNASVSVLDLERSRPNRDVFRELATVRNVTAAEFNESSFIL